MVGEKVRRRGSNAGSLRKGPRTMEAPGEGGWRTALRRGSWATGRTMACAGQRAPGPKERVPYVMTGQCDGLGRGAQGRRALRTCRGRGGGGGLRASAITSPRRLIGASAMDLHGARAGPNSPICSQKSHFPGLLEA